MKKMLFILSVLFLSLGLIACGNDSVPEDVDTPETEEIAEETEVDNHAELTERADILLDMITTLFPMENALDVGLREDGTLVLAPYSSEWIDFQILAQTNEEVAEAIVSSVETLSEVIYSTFGLENVRVMLMSTASDTLPVVIAENGEIVANIYDQEQ